MRLQRHGACQHGCCTLSCMMQKRWALQQQPNHGKDRRAGDTTNQRLHQTCLMGKAGDEAANQASVAG